VAVKDIPNDPYVVIDLYGQCQMVQVVTEDDGPSPIIQTVEYREKADFEEGGINSAFLACHLTLSHSTGAKEKSRGTDDFVKNCEYRNLCSRFKAMLGLPGELTCL
jgi:neuralized-like protein 4